MRNNIKPTEHFKFFINDEFKIYEEDSEGKIYINNYQIIGTFYSLLGTTYYKLENIKDVYADYSFNIENTLYGASYQLIKNNDTILLLFEKELITIINTSKMLKLKSDIRSDSTK